MNETGKEITTKDMLNLFDAVTKEISTFGERTPEICAAIRKRIEQAGEQVDGELVKMIDTQIHPLRYRLDRQGMEERKAWEQIKQLLQSKRTVTKEWVRKKCLDFWDKKYHPPLVAGTKTRIDLFLKDIFKELGIEVGK